MFGKITSDIADTAPSAGYHMDYDLCETICLIPEITCLVFICPVLILKLFVKICELEYYIMTSYNQPPIPILELTKLI